MGLVMPQNVPDSAELIVLRLITGSKVSGGCKLRLFSTDLDVTLVTGLHDIDECTWPGYAAVGPALLWDTYATDANGKGRARTKEITYTRAAGAGDPQDVWGYYITVIIDGAEALLTIVKFAAKKTMTNAGDSFPLVADLLASNDPLP